MTSMLALQLLTDWAPLVSTGRAEGMVRSSQALSLEAVAALPLFVAPSAATAALREIDETRQQQLAEVSALRILRNLHDNCCASGVGFSHHGLQENKREVHNKCKGSGAKICT